MKDCNLIINFKQNGLRLDKYLSAKYTQIPITDIQKFIKKKEITINNRKIDFAYILKTNDTINFSKFIENILQNPHIKNEKSTGFGIDSKYINLFKKSIIFENQDLIIINTEGVIIRLHTADIRTCGRVAQGVKLMKVDDDANIISIAKVVKHEEEEEKQMSIEIK